MTLHCNDPQGAVEVVDLLRCVAIAPVYQQLPNVVTQQSGRHSNRQLTESGHIIGTATRKRWFFQSGMRSDGSQRHASAVCVAAFEMIWRAS